MQCTTIGVDLAKSVFQVSIANRAGRILIRKRLSRGQFDQFPANHPPASIVMETCSSAHYWAQKSSEFGHEHVYCMPLMSDPTSGGVKRTRQMPMR